MKQLIIFLGLICIYTFLPTEVKAQITFIKTFGYSSYYSGQQTIDDGYIITGEYAYGITLLKINSNGNQQWWNAFVGAGYGASVQQTRDRGYIIVGNTACPNCGGGNVYLIKTDANGTLQWQKLFGDTTVATTDHGKSVRQTRDGGFIIAGYTDMFIGGGLDVFLIKTDVKGNLQWQKIFGAPFPGPPFYNCSVQQTSDGGYIIVGSSLIKTDVSGDTLWTKPFGGNSVVQTSDGGYIIVGSSLIKTDANGDTLWTKHHSGNTVGQARDGGYIITLGSYDSSHFIKTDSNGNFVSQASKYRTIKSSSGLGAKAVKMQYKKGKLVKLPNEATVVKAEFWKIGKINLSFLGISQSVKDSIKKYAWVEFKNDKGKGGQALAKLFTSPHTGKAYPFDSLRKSGKKSKKISKAITPTFKTYNNVAIEQGVLFNLNLLASADDVLPYGFGSLVFSKNVTVAGDSLQGKSLTEIGMLFDSMMTYYSRYGITNDEGYAQLSLFVDSVLRPINEAFAANIDSTNFEIRVSISELKKNPYAINLLGVRTVEETGIVQQVSKPSSQQIPFAETKNTPKEFSLEQNYPNPFNPTTILSFVIGNSSLVTMKIYNVLGQEVATLLNNEELESGKHEIEFDGSKLSSGVYFYRLQVSEEGKQIFTETKKLVLMK